VKRKSPARSRHGRRPLLTAESISPSELDAIRCGRAEIRRGDYVTLDPLELAQGMATAHRKTNSKDLSPEHEAYLRREVRRGLDQLNGGQCAVFDAAKIIVEERQRRSGERKDDCDNPQGLFLRRVGYQTFTYQNEAQRA